MTASPDRLIVNLVLSLALGVILPGVVVVLQGPAALGRGVFYLTAAILMARWFALAWKEQ